MAIKDDILQITKDDILKENLLQDSILVSFDTCQTLEGISKQIDDLFQDVIIAENDGGLSKQNLDTLSHYLHVIKSACDNSATVLRNLGTKIDEETSK